MPTEQQLIESVRAIAADDADALGRDLDIAADVFRGVRSHRRRRSIAGAAAAVALVSVASYGGIHAMTDAATPPSSGDTDRPPGHTALPPEILDLRGKAVGDALGLEPSTGSPEDCGGTLAAYAPGHGFCVDIGNAPDDWLVSRLISDASRPSGPLRSLGIPWDSSLPAPPPVVVRLVEAKVDEIGDTYGRHSARFQRASVNLDFARALWTDRAGWESADWNDDYWGAPWWPTDASDRPPAEQSGHTVLTPEQLTMRGSQLAEALHLSRVTGPTDCHPPNGQGGYVVGTGDGPAWCVKVGSAPDDWLAAMLVWNTWNPGERYLRYAGIDWTAELPPPPPAFVDLLSENLASVEAQYGQQSSEYDTAETALRMAMLHWNQQDRAGWGAAGWNDHYWGDPWWSTDE
jgi:hypothetical protein